MLCSSIAQRRIERKTDSVKEKYPGVPVFESFRKCPPDLKSRHSWWRWFDRKVLDKQTPKGVVLWKHEELLPHGTQMMGQSEITWTFRPEIQVTPVPMFDFDQTKFVRKQARTKAWEMYWDVFCRNTHPQYKVTYLPNGECRTWQGKITKAEAQGHFRGHRDYAVRMSQWTQHVGIDLDLHNGDPDVFLRQLEVLLDRLWGRETWHLQVKRQNAGGVHLFWASSKKQSTEALVDRLRRDLVQLDQEHPHLAEAARTARMPSLAKIEVKPTESTALRLPLASGRVMLLDKPLDKIVYRRNEEQDITGYMQWLQHAFNEKATHMPKQEVLQYVRERLKSRERRERLDTPIIVPPQTGLPAIHSFDPSISGESAQKSPNLPMKGRSWQLITHAWTGNMEPDSLNHWIRQLSLYTPFFFDSQEEAVELIELFIKQLSDHSFSDRLMNDEMHKVTAIIKRDVALAFAGWPDQPDPASSGKKLRAAWDRWVSTGRNLYDKSTWSKAGVQRLEGVGLGEEISFTPLELEQLRPLCGLLTADLGQIADVVQHLVRLIRVHPEVPRTWIVQILEKHGIKARSKKLDKPKILTNFLVTDAEWIYVAAAHSVGRCRRLGLTEVVRTKFQPVEADHWWDGERMDMVYQWDEVGLDLCHAAVETAVCV